MSGSPAGKQHFWHYAFFEPTNMAPSLLRFLLKNCILQALQFKGVPLSNFEPNTKQRSQKQVWPTSVGTCPPSLANPLDVPLALEIWEVFLFRSSGGSANWETPKDQPNVKRSPTLCKCLPQTLPSLGSGQSAAVSCCLLLQRSSSSCQKARTAPFLCVDCWPVLSGGSGQVQSCTQMPLLAFFCFAFLQPALTRRKSPEATALGRWVSWYGQFLTCRNPRAARDWDSPKMEPVWLEFLAYGNSKYTYTPFFYSLPSLPV